MELSSLAASASKLMSSVPSQSAIHRDGFMTRRRNEHSQSAATLLSSATASPTRIAHAHPHLRPIRTRQQPFPQEPSAVSGEARSALPDWLLAKMPDPATFDELVAKRNAGAYMRPSEPVRPPSADPVHLRGSRPGTADPTAPELVKGPHGTPAVWLNPKLRPRTGRRRSILELTPRTLGLSQSAAAILPAFQNRVPAALGDAGLLGFGSESTDVQPTSNLGAVSDTTVASSRSVDPVGSILSGQYAALLINQKVVSGLEGHASKPEAAQLTEELRPAFARPYVGPHSRPPSTAYTAPEQASEMPFYAAAANEEALDVTTASARSGHSDISDAVTVTAKPRLSPATRARYLSAASKRRQERSGAASASDSDGGASAAGGVVTTTVSKAAGPAIKWQPEPQDELLLNEAAGITVDSMNIVRLKLSSTRGQAS
jgi:hypothetical protein